MRKSFTITIDAPDGTQGIAEALATALDDPMNYGEHDVSEWDVTIAEVPGRAPTPEDVVWGTLEDWNAGDARLTRELTNDVLARLTEAGYRIVALAGEEREDQ
jgi:hypothetical protein